MDRKEAVSNQHSAISQNQRQNQQRFTTEDTESTKEGKTGQVNAEGEKRVRQRAEALVRKIGEACDELERLAEENPELVGRVTYGAEEHKEAYLRLKARLALADQAPRCRWIRQDGTTCGSPQMKKHIYCFAHKQMMEAQALALRLPAQEDANAIQIGIMRIQKALIEGTIPTKMAGLLLYSMQLAMTNVGKTTFGQAKAEEPVRETVDAETALSEKQTPTTETRRHGGEKTLPLMNADDTDKGEDLLRMNADDFDSGQVDEQFVPMPGGYGYTRVRLKIEPERRPAQAAVAEAGPAQPRAAVHPSKPTPCLPGAPAVPQEHGAEPLPKGPQFQPQHAQTARASGSPVASELLEASTQGSALQAEPRANLG